MEPILKIVNFNNRFPAENITLLSLQCRKNINSNRGNHDSINSVLFRNASKHILAESNRSSTDKRLLGMKEL